MDDVNDRWCAHFSAKSQDFSAAACFKSVALVLSGRISSNNNPVSRVRAQGNLERRGVGGQIRNNTGRVQRAPTSGFAGRENPWQKRAGWKPARTNGRRAPARVRWGGQFQGRGGRGDPAPTNMERGRPRCRQAFAQPSAGSGWTAWGFSRSKDQRAGFPAM